ncbi:MAG: hypothetical protein RLZ07_373 [Pseudomonadota bacterium]|jgi:hypothetical protein
MAEALSQNLLYELVTDFGEVVGIGLRRDSHLLRGIDDPVNWLELADQIGSDRAVELKKNLVEPSFTEVQQLICWQVKNALDHLHADITPTIWICQADGGQVLLIEGWGDAIEVELMFRVIGKYPSRTPALDELNRLYIFQVDDLQS